MMNADKQVMYSGVPQEDWENKSKYPRIMSNGPKSPMASEKSRRNSSLIAFLVLTSITILLSTGVVIGLHYLKYSEEDGFIFGAIETSNSSEDNTLFQKGNLKPKTIFPSQNPVESKNKDVENQNGSDHDAGDSTSAEISQLSIDTNGNQTKPNDNMDHSQVTEEVKENQENISNTIDNSAKEVENANANEKEPPKAEEANDKSKDVPEDNVGHEIQNGTNPLTNNTENTTEPNWFDSLKTETIPKSLEDVKELATKQSEEEVKDQTKNVSKETEEDKETEEEKEEEEKEEKEEKENPQQEKITEDKEEKEEDKEEKEEDKEEKEEDKEEREDQEEEKEEKEDSSLLYKAINNFAQKYFNSTNLNPSQVKDLFKNMSVGPSLEVILIASGIIFVGLSLLIIAIMVTRTRKIKIRREKIKKAVSDLEGAEKVILLTDEQSEDEYVKA